MGSLGHGYCHTPRFHEQRGQLSCKLLGGFLKGESGWRRLEV
jgi:hypothetical protein